MAHTSQSPSGRRITKSQAGPGPLSPTPAAQHNHVTLTMGTVPAVDRADAGRCSPSGTNRPGPARQHPPAPPSAFLQCNQEAAGQGREGARGVVPGLSRGDRGALPLPSPVPSVGWGPSLTWPLATGVGGREERKGTRAAAALSAGVPGAVPLVDVELCPVPLSGHSGHRGH